MRSKIVICLLLVLYARSSFSQHGWTLVPSESFEFNNTDASTHDNYWYNGYFWYEDYSGFNCTPTPLGRITPPVPVFPNNMKCDPDGAGPLTATLTPHILSYDTRTISGGNEVISYEDDGAREVVKLSVIQKNNTPLGANCQAFTHLGATMWRANTQVLDEEDRHKEYQYGKFEICCKLPTDIGAWPAFWLFGGDGEIDIMEALNESTSSQPSLYLHGWYDTPPTGAVGDQHFNYHDYLDQTTNTVNPNTGYHVYTLEWTPEYLKLYVDGEKILMANRHELEKSYFPNGPMELVVGMAFNPCETSPTEDIEFFIDYIRYYEEDACKNFVICDDNTTTNFAGNIIDVAIPADINYNGTNENYFASCSNDPETTACSVISGSGIIKHTKIIGNSGTVSGASVATLTVTAQEYITMHTGFKADATGSSGRVYLAQIDDCGDIARVMKKEETPQDVADKMEGFNSKIYPNPGNGLYTIEIDDESSFYLEVYDMMGRKLRDDRFNNRVYELDLKELQSGLYLIKITDQKNGSKSLARVIKQ